MRRAWRVLTPINVGRLIQCQSAPLAGYSKPGLWHLFFWRQCHILHDREYDIYAGQLARTLSLVIDTLSLVIDTLDTFNEGCT